MRYAAIVSASVLVLGLASAGFAASPSGEVMNYQGTEFVCTGVGNDARNDPRWNRFPLKMVFTNKDGDYLADVNISVSRNGGETVIEAKCKAPWLLANLDAGSYTAKVTAGGAHEKTINFQVKGDGQTQVVVPFPEISGT